jgi:hypothetical protein
VKAGFQAPPTYQPKTDKLFNPELIKALENSAVKEKYSEDGETSVEIINPNYQATAQILSKETPKWSELATAFEYLYSFMTISDKWKNRFDSKSAYRELLQKVFRGCAEIMASSAIIYVRTDARQFTQETTKEILRNVSPNKSIDIVPQPFSKDTQTALFGDKSKKPGEVDIIMYS